MSKLKLIYDNGNTYIQHNSNEDKITVKKIIINNDGSIPPIISESNVMITNLNADMLNGQHADNFLITDGSRAFTDNWNINSHIIKNVQDPLDDQDAVTLKWMLIYKNPGGRVVTGGGGDSNYRKYIEYIELSTPSNATYFGLLPIYVAYLTGTSNGIRNRALFIDGYNYSTSAYYHNEISYAIITTPSNAHIQGHTHIRAEHVSATSNGSSNKAIVTGGFNGTSAYYSYEMIYNIETTTTTSFVNHLLYADHGIAATSNGVNNRALLSGGVNHKNLLQYCNIETHSSCQQFGLLVAAAAYLSATSNDINNRAIIAGGQYGHNQYLNNISYVNITVSSNSNDFGDLTLGRRYLSAASNGINNRAIFIDGANPGSKNVIDYVNIMFPSNASNFGHTIYALAGRGTSSNGAL